MIRLSTTLLLSCTLCSIPLHAQDAHYWQSNYGPGSLLVPGAAVVYSNEPGLFYYNPALLAIEPKTTVSVTANIYQADAFRIKDGIGTGKTLGKTSFRINPQMVSGTLMFRQKKNLAIGYALMHNPVLSYQSTQRQDQQMDVLDNSYSPGKEYYVGQYAAHNYSSNTMAMGAVALRINDHWAIGLTAEAHIRSQDIFEQYSSTAIVNSTDSNILASPLSSVSSAYQAVYWHLGLRFKAGVSYDKGNHHFGLIISPPLLSIKGSATVSSEVMASNLRFPGTNLDVNFWANGRQAGLPVTYKMPLSIATGYAYDYGKGQLYIAGEYFFPVKNYNLITPANTSFIRPDTGGNRAETTALLQMREQRKSVLNAAVGVSYRLSENITFIGSFRTDFTYNTEEKTAEYAGRVPHAARSNNYHLQLGGNVRRRKLNLRAGLLLTYGATSGLMQPVNFDNPSDRNLLLGDTHPVKASFFSAGLMLAYVHNL